VITEKKEEIMVSTYRRKLRTGYQRSTLRYDGKDILIVYLHELSNPSYMCIAIFQPENQ
jgi:hypothetical protein